MKLVIQRVSQAQVLVEKKVISSIGRGLFVLVGIGIDDTQAQADVLAGKLSKLRIMSDEAGKMNMSVAESGGEVLVVSQFTLLADTKGGNRPSFVNAAHPETAEPLYEYFVEKLKGLGLSVKTGQFGADMYIDAKLDGPVTIVL